MIVPAVASNVPAWLAAVLVAITGVGALANALSGIVGGLFQIRRLKQMDRERAQLDEERHVELLAAVRAEVESEGEDQHG